MALRKIDTIHLPSVDKSGPDVLQKPPQAQDTPPTRASDTITRPTEPPPKIPQPAERSQPVEVPQKPHISDLPPKPQLSDLPPKPQLSDLPPKPQLSDLPPKPQLKDLPPKPQLSDLLSKPTMSSAAETTQRQTTQEETSPKPQLTEMQSSSQQEELSPRQASEDTNGAPAGAVEMPVPMPRKINTVVSERPFKKFNICTVDPKGFSLTTSAQILFLSSLKGIVHPKMKILSLITLSLSFQTHKIFVHLRNTN